MNIKTILATISLFATINAFATEWSTDTTKLYNTTTIASGEYVTYTGDPSVYYNAGVIVYGTLIIENGETLKLNDGAIMIDANRELEIKGGTSTSPSLILTYNPSSDKTAGSPDALWVRGHVIFSQANAVTAFDTNGNQVAAILRLDATTSGETLRKPVLTFNADQTFRLQVSDGTNPITFNFGAQKDATVTFTQTTLATSSFVLSDFVDNGTIIFKNDVTTAITQTAFNNGALTVSGKTATFSLTDANGNAVDMSDVEWNWEAVEGGFALSASVAVPEPAEWAAIFGTLALALAVYRRRK